MAQTSGDGPVDAIFGAIREATGTDAELQRYEVEAVTGGTDALGAVSVSVRANGRLASGQGVATDILEASARAFVRAISNALEGVAIREAEDATADAAVERTPGPVGRTSRARHLSSRSGPGDWWSGAISRIPPTVCEALSPLAGWRRPIGRARQWHDGVRIGGTQVGESHGPSLSYEPTEGEDLGLIASRAHTGIVVSGTARRSPERPLVDGRRGRSGLARPARCASGSGDMAPHPS